MRKLGGEHEVYFGPHLIGKIKIPDLGEVSGSALRHQEVLVEIDKVVEANRHVLEVYEKISLNILDSLKQEYDTVIVP